MQKNEKEQPHLPKQETLVAPAAEFKEVEEDNDTMEWEDDGEIEYKSESQDYEEIINSKIERERYYQGLLIELAAEARIEINYNNNNAENEAQYMNLDKAYLDSSNKEYKDTGYGYYQSHLGHDQCWWNTNIDEEIFTEFPLI
ncbi:412_t:CDS:2 [Dentiscutata erythropus]|uniref:412_t:CDS:1 n=1 Tax=Dentiscutata erythropus TaxID=1348616 RepID=A0A9N9AQ15_9GLOM|nr:412_t:CDS:2 [Dentiscutata erythropus]